MRWQRGHDRSGLVKEALLDLGGLLPLCVLPGSLLAHLTVRHGLLSIGQLGSLLSGERLSIVGLVPLTEGGSVNDNDGILDEGFGPDKLVVASIVDNIDDPGLASSSLRGPCKVASVEPECPVLLVATPGPDGVDPLGSQLSHRWGASQLKLPLLPDGASLASCGPPLMPVITRDTHFNDLMGSSLVEVNQAIKAWSFLPDGASL